MFVCIYRNSSQFTEPEGSLPHSQAPATSSYPETDLSSPCIHIPLLEDPSTPGPSKWSLSLGSPHQNPLHTLPAPIRATCPAHLMLLDMITQIILGEYRSLSTSLCSFLHSPVTSSLLGPNILHSTIFLLTLILCSFLSVRDQVTHPYKTKGKITVLYIFE